MVGNENFSHLDPDGQAHMVDISEKQDSKRTAKARATISMAKETIVALQQGDLPKGDVFAVARVAGIQAAKRTGDIIPLCHPLMLSSVKVEFEIIDDKVEIEAEVTTVGRTGVEMEALTACSVSALTIYDMCKSMDKRMEITDLALLQKTGGLSGDFIR
ncbi:MAG: cyclic pyranopterin monophosphate synthase MoaC [Acidimicrobiaceae bacterium]|nr:cyclic pyranopterin monophosphate synthase MoaC [Acidimicrobiaceae bacterium]MBN99652.1 cyclic pyranopterin monophosphate synthase MoaC [Acidimicrobiaceae bacterium]HAY51836.1 cyclic pyranopterin monophosphate synthase MoaC [Acidimicrobiaceae bacterium]